MLSEGGYNKPLLFFATKTDLLMEVSRMEESNRYVLGITLYSKEEYDRLMNNHSTDSQGFFPMGIDFKGMFNGYPPEYPCLLEIYLEDDRNPFMNLRYHNLFPELLNDGFAIRFYKEGVFTPQMG